ncbi:ABC-2 type transport system permease protein [Catenulispora sp. GP43]|uniref:ABC transporter permease n=1 Tax=Catenulispora sp. GP43 TaxID=3156263 RepID=UPI0035113CF5
MTTANFAIPKGVLRAEWLKLRSVRSTYAALGLAMALAVFVGVTSASGDAQHWATMTPADRANFDPVGDSLSGFVFGELALGALGVLVATSEYATGLIRATFTAVPRRGQVFAAKALTLAGLTLVVGQVFVFICYGLGQAALTASSAHLAVGLGHPGVLRALICANLYLTAVTLIGFGLGTLVRHTGAGIALVFTVTYLAYPVAGAFNAWTYVPDRWLLSNIADTLASVSRHPSPKDPGSLSAALAELAIYLAVVLGLGAWRMRKDA